MHDCAASLAHDPLPGPSPQQTWLRNIPVASPSRLTADATDICQSSSSARSFICQRSSSSRFFIFQIAHVPEEFLCQSFCLPGEFVWQNLHLQACICLLSWASAAGRCRVTQVSRRRLAASESVRQTCRR